MITKEQNEVWIKIVKQVFDSLNQLGEELKDSPVIQCACLTEIAMPIYDFLIKNSSYEHFQKCYQLYKATQQEFSGKTDS